MSECYTNSISLRLGKDIKKKKVGERKENIFIKENPNGLCSFSKNFITYAVTFSFGQILW